MEQKKSVINALENQFTTKKSFLKFLDLKRQIHGNLNEARLLNFERKQSKIGKDFFTESRKGHTALTHPYDGKIYIFGGLGRRPLHEIETYDTKQGNWTKVETLPTKTTFLDQANKDMVR